jgi:hypothetical protein
MRKKMPNFNSYIQVLNSYHVFMCWFTKSIAVKTYNEDFGFIFVKWTYEVGDPIYEIAAGPVYSNTPISPHQIFSQTGWHNVKY